MPTPATPASVHGTVNQPSAAPTRKVTASAIAGALTVLIVFLIEEFTAYDVDETVSGAITILIATLAGYFVPNAAAITAKGRVWYTNVPAEAVDVPTMKSIQSVYKVR